MGSSGGPSSQNVTQTNLPEYARPYFERLMDRTEGASNEGYTAYGGPRVEGLNDVQRMAVGNMSAMGPNAAAQHAGTLGQTAGTGMLQNANYTSGGIGSRYAAAPTSMFAAPDRVAATFKPGEFSGGDVSKYMSPYQQGVTDIAKREATRTHNTSQAARDMSAAKAGAFGGSRAALVKAEADRSHEQQLNDIQMKGGQQAFENAQQQYERDRQARYNASQQGLGAAQFNSQQQMAYGQAGQQNQQFNEGQRQRSWEMDLQGQIANEQANAAAAGIRSGSWNNLGQLAGTMAGVGKTQQDLDLQRYNAALVGGDKVQQTNQASLDAAYDNFVNQRDYDKQNLNFYSNILRGVPVTANSDVQTRTASNPLAQVAGLGIAGLGAYNAYKG